MKVFITLFFLIIAINCIAQNMPLFDKVVFKYSKGHNSWDEPGVYSKGELFELFPFNSKYYKIKRYLKINYNAGKDGKTFFNDTMIVNDINQSNISKPTIDSLFSNLTTNKDNFNLTFIKSRLKSPAKNEILTIAINDSLNYKFEDADPSYIKKSINEIRNFDSLDSFIKLNRPDTNMVTVVSDAWDLVQISFIKNKDTTVFNQSYFKLLGQPFLKLKFNKLYIGKQFVNLEVNTILESILPKSSILRKHVGINSLTESYILWYIKEKI